MKTTLNLFLALLFFFSQASMGQGKDNKNFITENIKFIVQQYTGMLQKLSDDEEPRTLEADGSLKTAGARAWTAGYFTASLWYLYKVSGKKKWKKEAEKRTEILMQDKKQGKFAIGFIHCLLNAQALAPQPTYKDALLSAAEEMSAKIDPKIGMSKAWENRPRWNYPVMVDHLANLEVLFWAAKNGGNPDWYGLAQQQALLTLQEHKRPDHSVFQVVDYDSITGKIVQKANYQGLNETSTWSRGQAWAIYGFTMIYRETREAQFLEAAKTVTDYFIGHLPEEGIPYWDFNDPEIPNTYKDASAAALACAGMIELSRYADSEKYLVAAQKTLQSLSSPAYQNALGQNHHFLLKHSVGNKPGNKEIDVPLVYADYYYVEALVRYIDKLQILSSKP